MNIQTIQWVFSGVGIALFSGGFWIIKYFLLPHPVINITEEEKPFLTGYLKFFRRLFFELYAFYALTTLALFVTNLNINEHEFSRQFPYVTNLTYNTATIIVVLLIFLLVLIILLVLLFSKEYYNLFIEFKHEKITKKKKRIIILILMLLYSLIVTLVYGYINNLLMLILDKVYTLQQTQSFRVITVLPTYSTLFGTLSFIIFTYLVCRLFLQPVASLFNKIVKTVILATITLNNGEKLQNKFILRPTIDGNILIGNKPNISEAEKIMLPKTSILYIEFKRLYVPFEDKDFMDFSEDINNKKMFMPELSNSLRRSQFMTPGYVLQTPVDFENAVLLHKQVEVFLHSEFVDSGTILSHNQDSFKIISSSGNGYHIKSLCTVKVR